MRQAESRKSLGTGLGVALAGLLVGLLLGRGLGAEASTSGLHPLEWDGHRFIEFSPAEKEAYLGGFIAGAGASQAYVVLADVFDRELLGETLSELREERGLNFPYAPNLYHARMHDFYFYVDRRDRPIYQAIAELNFQLQAAQH